MLQKIGSHAYRLELPATVRIHNDFHVSLLSLANEDSYPGQHLPPPPPIEVDGEEEYEVDHIVRHKKNRQGRFLFLIRWKGYGPDEDSWEPASNLKHAREILNAYKMSHKLS